MDSSLRNTPALVARIEKLRDQMHKRFYTIIQLASIKSKDRNASALAQYQIETETAALVTAAEDAQSLIRQMQEMWLFGKLDTLGNSKAQQQADENAKAIAEVLKQLAGLQQPVTSNGGLQQAPAENA